MRHPLLAGSLICSVMVISAHGTAMAGRKGGGSTIGKVTVTPTQVTSPVTQENPLTICVSGFPQGYFVSVNVPMAGTPTSHSNIAYSNYVDATGGFCLNSPPTWTNLNLAPGAYTIRTSYARDGAAATTRSGPTGSFTVN